VWRKAEDIVNGMSPGDYSGEHYACGSGNWGDSGILDEWDSGRSPCWPGSLNMAASWDTELMERWSVETANEFGVPGRGQLGPGMNVARFAWNGRLGEYHSGEDPYLGAKFMEAMMGAYRKSSGTGVMPPLQVAKHFIANTMERDRTSMTAKIDERTLFEVYYPPFIAAIEGGVSAIMCSYNLVQCTSGMCTSERAYACANDDILNKHLKQTMGFKGIVMSDWDATKCQPESAGSKGCTPGHYVDKHVAASAGLDLEMPACMTMQGGTEVKAKERATRMWWAYLVQGRHFGRASFRDAGLREAYAPSVSAPHSNATRGTGGGFCCWWPQPPAQNICASCVSKDFNFQQASCNAADSGTWCGGDDPAPNPSPNPSPSPAPSPTPSPAPLPERCPDRGNNNYKSSCKLQLAGRIVTESTVVLKNEGEVLPLSKHSSVALIGSQACASDPLAIAGGSGWNGMACQDVHKVNLKDGISKLGVGEVSCPDQSDHGNSKAGNADVIVAVVVPAKASEGSDRSTLQLSSEDTQLIRKYSQAGHKVIVAMNAPGPMITSTWDAKVAGLLVSWLPGVANGDGIAQALYNESYEASGRLPVTFPKCSTEACSHEDERSSVALGKEIDNREYWTFSEKALIGYRWYHATGSEVSYPFGAGLFAYGRSSVAYDGAWAKADGQGMKVGCKLKNTGKFSGRDVPQLYLSFPKDIPGDINSKPEWQLKGFQKVLVAPSSPVEVTFALTKRDLSYWDDAPGMSKWVCAAGEFTACIGANAQDAIKSGKGTCSTFSSPCGQESSVIQAVEVWALQQQQQQPRHQQQTRHTLASRAALVASCSFLVAAAGVIGWRRVGAARRASHARVEAMELLEANEEPQNEHFVE